MKGPYVPLIAALQYEALRQAWPIARAKHPFTEQDEADWGATMELLWERMTLAEQQAVEADLANREEPVSPQCPAMLDGSQCAYERSTKHHVHWTLNDDGEFIWTDESQALREIAKQLQRLADGVEVLADAAETDVK